jgi:anti-anti-sigma factor
MVSINLSPRINLSSRECDGRAVVALRGELDVADAASVAAALNAVAVRARELIVDLAGLEFIDSSGLTALLLARKQARKAGVTCCSPGRKTRCCGFLPPPGWPVCSPSMPASARRLAAPAGPR